VIGGPCARASALCRCSRLRPLDDGRDSVVSSSELRARNGPHDVARESAHDERESLGPITLNHRKAAATELRELRFPLALVLVAAPGKHCRGRK
jgi:hypothetical protein